MKNIYKFLLLTFFLSVISCDLDRDLENPNDARFEVDANLLMNKIQAEFGDFFAEASTPAMEVTRMIAMTGGDTYEQAYFPQDFNDIWERGYQDVLVQIETLLPVAEEEGFTRHAGIAKVLKAYTLVTLVDLFGDVPFSAALQGQKKEFNPTADPGSKIYADALAILDDAIATLATAPSLTAPAVRDIYYGGNAAKWTALANTLKLKIHLNLGLTQAGPSTAAINTLLNQDLIDTDAEEFTYKYGTSDIPLRSRHPLYRQMYTPLLADAAGYLSNYYMFEAYKGKGVEDPRWRYYFYRQVGSIATALDEDPEAVPCVFTPKPAHYSPSNPFCTFEPGFFGRDHGNGDGIPPDAFAITAFGVYPAGGRLDTNEDDPEYFEPTQQGQGANGAGIEPMLMANFTDFMKAEAALMLGTAGDARALLESAVRGSINRVIKFATEKSQLLDDLEPDAAAIDTYVNKVLALYDAAPGQQGRLNVIAKEYYLALWGNGIEAYNLYRRTGKPEGIQPTRALNGGKFYRSFTYPADFVNLNSSVDQKPDNSIQVFWDANPPGFVN